MGMNRRNVLIGLGTVTAGGGAVFASGAFSQVEADRSVSVATAGDASALVALSVDDSYNGISDGGTGTQGETIIDISLENINDDAVTTFDDVLTITNNGNNSVALSIDDSAVDGVAFTLANSALDASGSGGTESTTASIEVDTKSTVSDGDVTITATDNS